MPTSQRYGGIDEAGLGPTLGPLAIAMVTARSDSQDLAAIAREVAPQLGDSKKIYTAGRLAPLEEVALAIATWVHGRQPTDAAEYFSLFDESEADRAATPWMAGAADLSLPLATDRIPDWNFPNWSEPTLHGHLVHPSTLNADKQAGINRSACELRHIQDLLARLTGQCSDPMDLLVDRLGGRRYYQQALQETWPAARVAILAEGPRESRYQVHAAETDRSDQRLTLTFCVGGESRSPFTAMASCLAKYARELHMHLFNNYWCSRYTWLRPTAGYPEDAKRWLFQLGEGTINAYDRELVRR